MKNKYTIILIPPDQSSTHQFQLSKRGRKYLGAGLLLFGLIIIGIFAQNLYLSHYIKELQPTIVHIDQLQSKIEERDQEISNLTEKSNQVTKDLTEITNLEAKLSTILKIHPSTFATPLSRSTNLATQSYTPSTPQTQTSASNSSTLAAHISLLQKYYEAAVQQKEQLDHTPSILPVQGQISSSFGYRRNPFGGWSSEFHNGIDIACNYGTPVLATADGIVTFAGWNSVYGRKIEIDHGNGIITFYGHNSRLLVKNGDHIKKFAVIAYSGNSGRSTGSHLHYGAIVNGKNTDSLTFTNPTKEE
ncbi:M23 family metallopeptidase [Desulfosporosinus sp. OT]|uniref:M23 family metallopeptidase n=1 Tax=Desulfosporosinus sp. OT TaxID=913865 RepID=UPI000223A9D1|nr:M23 family metallopeptidase [Desulfosporosinus sp. OT]EGW36334.1 peptidase M23 family protein [Desulfosporosinus sp. OT]